MKTMNRIPLFLLASACLVISSERSFGEPEAPDAAAITSTVEAFHKALAAGERDRVMALLLPDALIVEGGSAQTQQEYEREHLGEDIAFARAVPGTLQEVVVRQEGHAAWVTRTFRVVGDFQGRAIDNMSAETVVLTKTSGGWGIRTIHWSSHKAGAGERGNPSKSSPKATPETKP
jgi:ketosteroid isomerase-like protein